MMVQRCVFCCRRAFAAFWSNSRAMNTLLKALTVLCYAWLLSWVVLGGTSSGKNWFGNFVGIFFPDTKGGQPIVTIAVPILLSATLIVLLGRSELETIPQRWFILPSQMPAWLHRFVRFLMTPTGDRKFDQVAILFIVSPCLTYAATSTYRHLLEADSLDDRIMETGNAFGFAALIAMSVLLIPVARHSAVLKVFGWNPASAIRLHIWSGRVVIGGASVHGSMHLYRWKFVSGQSWMYMLFPPAQCWRFNSADITLPDCTYECTCYKHFRNLTGFLAVLGLLAIAVSSLERVRRASYTLFYRIHILAGPLVLVMTIVHWNRSILYVAGGLLYFIASSLPVMMEARSCCRRDGGVEVLSVQHLPASASSRACTSVTFAAATAQSSRAGSRPCLSLTLSASPSAMSQCRAGQYVKLLVPELSFKSHPFTINAVPGKSNQLRIIFREVGPFTRRLALRLTDEAAPLPVMHVDGYHGPSSRVEQALQHDAVVLVAGGIGITPYLSLLHRMYESILNDSASTKTKNITLHWICRDTSLIDYVQKEYFDPLQRLPKLGGCTVRITVHRTCAPASDVMRPVKSYSDLENPQDDAQVESRSIGDGGRSGLPFAPSRFAPLSSPSFRLAHRLVWLPFLVIVWLGLLIIWKLYKTAPSEKILTRLWSPLLVVLGAVGLAVLSNLAVVTRLLIDDTDATAWSRVRLSTSEDEAEEALEMTATVVDGHDNDMEEAAHSKVGNEALRNLSSVVVEQREGRPTPHQLVSSLDNALRPGLFLCGPPCLMNNVREAAWNRCCMRMSQCVRGEPNISSYEESFQM